MRRRREHGSGDRSTSWVSRAPEREEQGITAESTELKEAARIPPCSASVAREYEEYKEFRNENQRRCTVVIAAYKKEARDNLGLLGTLPFAQAHGGSEAEDSAGPDPKLAKPTRERTRSDGNTAARFFRTRRPWALRAKTARHNQES
ncbi:hypothetical protein AURDEDRAFT_124295 [Auricularia subglabra TFB-10046 SS5]|nr:hypothetical protein AURDEDRAFT_124295 [Auricularia subglabra TFB-10046 SS5]